MTNIESKILESIIKINRCLTGITKNYFIIAEELYHLKNGEAIENTNYKGYKNISELAESEFGFSKSKTYDLIAIYDKFFINKPVGFFNNYKYGQLRHMISMTDEQLQICKEEMTVKEIIDIKNNFSTRVEKESIANAELTKNNNVIEGIFPEKKEEKAPEEKVTTIIVTELPKEPVRENKTITVELKKEQNDDYATNDEKIETWEALYYDEHDKNVKLQLEIVSYKNKIRLLEEKNKKTEENYFDIRNMYNYCVNKLYDSIDIEKFEKVKKLYCEMKSFSNSGKLPEKLHFMKNVI